MIINTLDGERGGRGGGDGWRERERGRQGEGEREGDGGVVEEFVAQMTTVQHFDTNS